MKTRSGFAEIVAEAENRGCPTWEIILEREEKDYGVSRQEQWETMARYWKVMSEAATQGIQPGNKSLSGLVGEEAALLHRFLGAGKPLSGAGTAAAAAKAMAVAIVNASMGKIVAAPTAGSCGILPGVLLTVAEQVKAPEERIIGALFTAAGLGRIIDENATTAGAEGGCQAECGSASGMAAAAAVELAGGTPGQAAHAGAIALKAFLGQVCDPVAGLVEVPCMKRNAMGAANALLAADLAMAGIESKIPIDEVIGALKEIGDLLPESLKETAQAGLANTSTARKIEKEVLK